MATPDFADRRRSGLWSQNPVSGAYERESKPSGPYQYYQPPISSSSSAPRRSFSERSAITSAYESAVQNKVSGAGSILDENRRKDLALATHAKIAASLHAYSGDAKSEDFARANHAMDIHSPGKVAPPARKLQGVKPALSVDPEAVPENVRSTGWDAEPASATTGRLRSSSASDAAPARRPSVQDKSPLQDLEDKLGHISKEEKRARMEQLENVARQKSVRSQTGNGPSRSSTLRSEKGRVVSDGSRRPIENRPQRQVTAGAPIALPPVENGARRFRQASDALREQQMGGPERQRSVRHQPPIVNNPRPYHHAPETPRSLAANPQPGAPPRIVQAAQPYHHAPEAPTSVNVAAYPHNAGRQSHDGGRRTISNPIPIASSGDMNRSNSTYKRRLRDAGFAGAAAAVAGAGAYELSAADRGKAAYDKRRSTGEPAQDSPTNATSDRSNSRRLQKPYPQSQDGVRRSIDRPQQQPRVTSDPQRDPLHDRQALQSSRMGDGEKVPPADQDPDPVPRAAVATGPDTAVPYKIPPQTANAQEARELVGFDQGRSAGAPTQDKQHRFRGMFHRHGEDDRRVYSGARPLDEWRGAKPLRLGLSDVEFDGPGSRDAGNDAWREQEKAKGRRSSSGAAGVSAAQYDGPYEEEAKAFRPPLYLKCGPLLRYTGIRKEPSSSGRGEREIWRGSIMIVTEDEQSDYSSVPTLRLFAQPMELHTPPPRHMQEVPPEDEDPVAGQVKISRTGRPLYVRPVHDIEGGVDLSREENNSGLYAATRSPMLGPQFSSFNSDGRQITFQDKSRIRGRDGEKAGRYRELRAVRLHTERGFTFWRWSLEIELGSTQHRVAYRINRGPALGFWVPARNEMMNIMFHSCNGFSMSVDSKLFSGPDPLWRDVLNRHQSRPFHVMIGGGDQIYNDAAMRDTQLFRDWLQTKNPEHKHHAPFSAEMQEELEEFYLNRYAMWFSQGLFAMAASQVPMVNLWDDHDIIDGFGSYPHHFMSTPVFTGLGAVAFKYYMLFQHQSLPAETTREEPSWVLGASPGPYIAELARSVCLSLGRRVVFLGIDCRTERMRDEILSQQSYDILFDRARAEIQKGETRHLIVLLGVPIAYPRLNFLENILTSRVMDPIKAIGRTGMLGGFVNKFDGGVEILDDLDDHWTAKHHKEERNWFVQELQHLAAEKSVRVTILGGDVHLAAVGQFYTPKKFGVPKDKDHRYMPNVISSAIVNTPPPVMMADVLNRRNKVHHLDAETDEDMIGMFEVDVDGSKRGNKHLLPRRNYCTIREFIPGSTPPPTPPNEPSVPGTPGSGFGNVDGQWEREERDRRFPPGSMGRTRSLTRMPGMLVRRLSGSGGGRNPPSSLAQQGGSAGLARSSSLGGPPGRTSLDGGMDGQGQPQRPINMFHRRPTNLSEKEIRRIAKRGGAFDGEDEEGDGREPGHINLEGGLDISLNVEADQKDPSGHTESYRLLVPTLFYEGGDVGVQEGEVVGQEQRAGMPKRGVSFLDRFRNRRKRGDEYYSDEEYEDEQTPPPSWGQQVGGYDGAAAGVSQQKRSMDAPAGPYNNKAAYSPAAGQQQPPPPQPRNYPYANAPRQPQQAGPYQQQDPQYRRASAPVSQKHTQQQVPGPYSARGHDEYSDGEGSFTDEEDMGRAEPRRLSKAQRFLGMGDDSGPRRGSMGNGGGYAGGDGEYEGEGRRKPKWMIWK